MGAVATSEDLFHGLALALGAGLTTCSDWGLRRTNLYASRTHGRSERGNKKRKAQHWAFMPLYQRGLDNGASASLAGTGHWQVRDLYHAGSFCSSWKRPEIRGTRAACGSGSKTRGT